MKLRMLMLGTVLATANALAEPRGFTVEDMVRMERIGSPVLAPDASRVVYTVRATDIDKNRGHTELWMMDLRSPHAQPQRLTHSAANSSDPEWSPSGDAVFFTCPG